jgi:hypothetical protein
VRAVRRAKCIIDVCVSELRQIGGQLGVVLRLAGLIANVLQQQDVTVAQRLGEM